MSTPSSTDATLTLNVLLRAWGIPAAICLIITTVAALLDSFSAGIVACGGAAYLSCSLTGILVLDALVRRRSALTRRPRISVGVTWLVAWLVSGLVFALGAGFVSLLGAGLETDFYVSAVAWLLSAPYAGVFLLSLAVPGSLRRSHTEELDDAVGGEAEAASSSEAESGR